MQLRKLSIPGLLLALSFLSLPAAPTMAETKLVKQAIAELVQAGFAKDRILEKTSTKGNLKIQLLRVRSGPRLYDLSLVSKAEFYLAVSYNDGKKFGRLRKFDKLATAVQIMQRIEARELERLKQRAESSGEDQQQLSGKGDDQRAGLDEKANATKPRQPKRRRKMQIPPPRQLTMHLAAALVAPRVRAQAVAKELPSISRLAITPANLAKTPAKAIRLAPPRKQLAASLPPANNSGKRQSRQVSPAHFC